MEIDLLVISGHYKRSDEGTMIELHCRSGDGRSVTVLYEGFKPYFYIVEPHQEVLDELGRDPSVKGLSERELTYEGRMRRCLKVEIKFPFDVPAYRKRWSDAGYEILAADIPFINRFYYDLDLGCYIKVSGDQVEEKGYGTDIQIRAVDITSIDPFPVDLKVMSFDIENSIRTGEIYMVGYSIGSIPLKAPVRTGSVVSDDGSFHTPIERERDLIDRFVKVVLQNDPDIITGYNIDGYDIPHILKRMKNAGRGGLEIGRDGSAIEKMGYRSWRLRGRIVLDAWWEAKKAFRPKKETLDAVSRSVLGEGKDDIDTSKIEDEWEKRREDVIKYCERDSELALRILDRTQSVKKGVELSYVAKLPIVEGLTGTTSVLIDSILIRRADRENIGIPLTRHETKTDKIEGAYVHSVEPGLYKWVAVLDFRSMYPSLMIEHNICFTTLSSDPGTGEPSPIPGARFIGKDSYQGLVPRILKELMEDRQNAKAAMRSAKDPMERDYYNGLQEAIKVLMNSFYGVFASYFYRFTDRSIGAAITAYARESIMGIISTLTSEDLKVIYSDTDSVFIQSPHGDLDRSIEFGKDLSRRFSMGATHLEFEKLFMSFFTHGKKKRYVGKQVWPVEDIVVRGYEIRRTDAFDLQSDTLNSLFRLVLEDNVKEGLDLARDMVRRCRSGDVDTSSLVISRSVQEVDDERIEEAYKNPDSLSNVQALKKTRDMGIEVVPGMKVSWIVTDGRSSPQKVEPYIDGRRFDHSPDHQYYAERLASTLSRVTEVFGVSEKELLTGASQASLFDSFGAEGEDNVQEKSEGRIGPRRPTERKFRDDSTLDRWM